MRFRPARSSRTALGVGFALTLGATSSLAGTVTHESKDGRDYRVFVPDAPTTSPPAPVVVLLHGCTQTPDSFADATRFDVVAEEEGVVAIYPEQPTSLGTNGCFRWYEPAHQGRDAGEPLAIATAVSSIVTARGLDAERVYIAGISAGAAMSLVLAVTYPDRFAAVASLAGTPYASASSYTEGAYVAYGGSSAPELLGQRAFDAMGARARPMPLLVIHGTADGIVAPVNGTQSVAQFRDLNERVLGSGALLAPVVTSGTVTDGYAFTHTATLVASGASVVEHLEIKGLGHAWPGGKSGASYADPKGPDASRAMWAFFAPRTRTTPIPTNATPTLPPGATDVGDGGTSAPPLPGGGDGTPDGVSPGSRNGAPETSGGCSLSQGRVTRATSEPFGWCGWCGWFGWGAGLGVIALARRIVGSAGARTRVPSGATGRGSFCLRRRPRP